MESAAVSAINPSKFHSHLVEEQKDRERALNDLRDGYTKIICATASLQALGAGRGRGGSHVSLAGIPTVNSVSFLICCDYA